MVDVGAKPVTERQARASARVRMAAETLEIVRDRKATKGDVLEVARLAGIMAAKQTGNLIPLCHPLPLDSVTIAFEFVDGQTISIESQVKVTARTGGRNGSHGSGQHRRTSDLRHVQSGRSRHDDRIGAVGREVGWKKRALCSPRHGKVVIGEPDRQTTSCSARVAALALRADRSRISRGREDPPQRTTEPLSVCRRVGALRLPVGR